MRCFDYDMLNFLSTLDISGLDLLADIQFVVIMGCVWFLEILSTGYTKTMTNILHKSELNTSDLQ